MRWPRAPTPSFLRLSWRQWPHMTRRQQAAGRSANHTPNGIHGVASPGGAYEQRPTHGSAYRPRHLPSRERGTERDRVRSWNARRPLAFWNGRIFRRGGSEPLPHDTEPTARAVALSLTAPMPATVLKVLVVPGSLVKKGDTVVVLEAMKMELPVRTSREGVITAVHCREGELVQPDTALVEIADAPGS